jgi:hypothetical protein
LPKLEEYLKETKAKESLLVNLNKFFTEGKIYRLFTIALESKSKLVDFIIEVAKTTDYATNLMIKDKELIDLAFITSRPLSNKEDFEKELKIIKIEDKVESLKKLKKITEVLATLEYLHKIKPIVQ